MTDRLYYQDPEALRFRALLVRQQGVEGHWQIVLDRTAFYPEGGGHPPDRGTINGLQVEDVREIDGDVVHFLSEPLGAGDGTPAGSVRVDGAVDPAHRREFEQQHSGQHIVSASLEESAAAATVSAHLGEHTTSVEIDRDSLGEDELERAEVLANRIVTENRPVRIHWLGPEELGQFKLRKPPPAGIERLRVVEIPGYDASACGGLHVRSTGQVGLIQLVGAERIRGRLRLSWRIGDRAYREARKTERLARDMGRELSSTREELLSSLMELKERLRGREQEADQLKHRLGALLAERLREEGRRLGGATVVLGRVDEPDPELVEVLFRTLLSAAGTVAVLVHGQGSSLRWLAGTSPELDFDLGALIVPHLHLIDGRGGGRGHRWQGVGGHAAGTGPMLAAVTAALEDQLGAPD